MPAGDSQYSLVGFSPELDWRPLSFVKPIPPNRLCCACGLVRNRTALLPCTHILCETCYEQSVQQGTHVCPLDGYECHDEEEVDWKDIPADHLLKREVRCWNEERGCTSVMAASELSRHFQRDCGHHSVSCPKCSAGVLYSDVCSHLRSGCGRKVTPLDSEAEVPSNVKDSTLIYATLRAAIGTQAIESRRLFERLSSESAAHGDRLNEVLHAINTLRATLKQDLAAETRQTRDIFTESADGIAASVQEVKSCFTTLRDAINNLPVSIDALEKRLKDDLVKETTGTRDHLTQIAASMKAEVEETVQTTAEKIRQYIGHPKLEVTISIFKVKGIKELGQKALKEGWSRYESEKVYLRGYCIIPGIFLIKEGESVKLCSRLTLCKGDIDDFLQWPFEHKVSLCVVHPIDGSRLENVSEPKSSLEYFQKPTQPQNKPCYLRDSTLILNDLINGGFVESDSILVRW